MSAGIISARPADWLRWAVPIALGLLIVILLFWLMSRMVRPQIAADGGRLIEVFEQVELVQVEPEQEPEGSQAQTPDAAPPPPPPAPMMSQPDLPGIVVPAMVAAPLDSASLQLSTALTGIGSGMKLGSIGGFGGFAGKGGGGGGSGAGYGTGQGFVGKPLVPLSTARPQMPEWACKQKIKGWVEVVFIVLPTGRVSNVRLVDADPRGVFEGPAIESITNWIYPSSNSAREVKQRVPMDPEDCAYNWQ